MRRTLNDGPRTADKVPVLTVDRLAPEEPLSPELVLVLPPELRAEALARLPQPVWQKAQSRVAAAPVGRIAQPGVEAAPEGRKPQPRVAAPPARTQGSMTQLLATVLVARVAQLMLIFVSVTVLILMLATVANAVR